jgi:hypothetical protein
LLASLDHLGDMAGIALYHAATPDHACAAMADHLDLTPCAFPTACADASVPHSTHDWPLSCVRMPVPDKDAAASLASGCLVNFLIIMLSEHVIHAELLDCSVPCPTPQVPHAIFLQPAHHFSIALFKPAEAQ